MKQSSIFRKQGFRIVRITGGIVFWLFMLALTVPGQAAESILSFSSNIVVLTNGSVDVTETITVRAEGQQIRRGIFRDIPTTLTNDDGSVLRSNLSVTSVAKDSFPEPFFTEPIPNGTRIFIGERDVFLSTGTYQYTIRYTMTRMARFFENYDELYWNATGNFWNFPIEAATATVTLPDGANITELNVYTGKFGESGNDAGFTRTSDTTAFFRSSRIFGPGEGMSVVALFDKGILVEPGGTQKVINFLSDRRATILPLIAVFLVLLYYYFSWDAVGRDPEKGTIIPLFRPPENFSPALVHYVHRMGWKKNGWTAFSAALVSLAIKGMVEIGKVQKKSTFTSLKNDASRLKNGVLWLPSGETVINTYLVSQGKITVNKSSGPELNKTRSKFIKAIEAENQQLYFNNNIAYVLGGIALSIAALATLVVAGILESIIVIVVVAAGLGIGVLLSILAGLWSGGKVSKLVIIGIWVAIAASNMLGSLTRIFTDFSINMALISAVSIVIVNVVFFLLMRAPTVQGRKIMDQIDGFKLYLETAEENRLNFRKEPDFTTKRFEEILPFAIALGVEKPWANRFEGELSRNALAEQRRGYRPHWYSGSGFSSRTMSSDIAGIATGMSAAMISAQPTSSSSSGGGGGGFSGGGGGGGGGGGW